MPINHDYMQRFTVAPMLDWTTRWCRAFHRQLTKHAVLYTEMVACSTILNSKNDYLYFRPEWEGDVIIQLGGSNPQQFAEVARRIQQNLDKYPYVGINLNVGCPSPKVQTGNFGACLMAEPDLVAECMVALQDNCELPVSIKTRIGIDDIDSFEFLEDFVVKNMEVGVHDFVVHARKAYLKGLSPKENREVPPLNYQRVFDLKSEYPELDISINGGITDLTQSIQLLEQVDGVMMGREAYSNPLVLTGVDAIIFDDFNNDFSNLNIKFDKTLTADKSYTLYPKQYVKEDSQQALERRIVESIFAGYSVLNNSEPFYHETKVLNTEIFKRAAKYEEQALAEGRAYYTEGNLRPVVKHQPKSEISNAARFMRLQQIAATEAMFMAIERLRPFIIEEAERGVVIPHLFKPLLGAFNGIPGARNFRRYISENGFVQGANVDVIFYALDLMYEKFLQYVESSS